MKIFPSEPVSLPVSRAPALVVQSLEEQIVAWPWERMFRDRMIGRVSEDLIRIRRLRPFWRNDFAPQFVGAITSDGTRLDGRYQIRRLPRVFVCIWVGFVLIFFAPTTVVQLFQDGPTSHTLGMFAIMLAMAAFVGGMPWLGWWLGRADKQHIGALLQRAAGQAGA